jgi:hypothetical protein
MVRALVIINCCCLSSAVKPDTERHVLSNGGKMDPWLTQQFKTLMKLSCVTALKIKFEALSLPEFWIHI